MRSAVFSTKAGSADIVVKQAGEYEMNPQELVTVSMFQQMFRPLAQVVVQEALAKIAPVTGKLDPERLAFPEREAAAQMGVSKHVLRDARRRGEIQASRVGNRIVYTPEALRSFLVRQQCPRPTSMHS